MVSSRRQQAEGCGANARWQELGANFEIAALVQGRTKKQCHDRWHGTLVSNIDPTTTQVGRWTADEDKKLKDAVIKHGGKNWKEVAALVPGRTITQCYYRWKDVLDSSIALTAGRTGKWSAVEDSKLKDAVQTHGCKDWDAIAALLPGRTKIQCQKKWQVLGKQE
jgi:myb proto-oncogene protein